jgi:hypothetical protein
MSNVRLGELSLSDMLDVLHFMFEEDILASSTKEALEAKEKTRVTLYQEMYGREYGYASNGSGSTFDQSEIGDELSHDDIGDAPVPVEMEDKTFAIPPKRFIPATTPNTASRLPFGAGIDAPLG